MPFAFYLLPSTLNNMALINIDSLLKKVTSSLAKLDPDQGLEILSYKRNRGIDILKGDGDSVWVRERGYVEEEHETDLDGLPKLLKSLFKREFPRSRKVRLYQIANPEELGRQRKKL